MTTARSQLLLNVLTEHNNDLVKFASKLETDLNSSLDSISFTKPDQDPMWSALKAHIPRSAIWRGLKEYEDALTELKQRIEEAAQVMVAWLKSQGIHPGTEVGITESQLTSFFIGQLKEYARGGAPEVKNINMSETSDNMVGLSYGKFNMFKIPAEKGDFFKKVMDQIHPEMDSLPQVNEIKKMRSSSKDTAEKVLDELIVIRLKRMVPGECRYCPS